MKIISLNIGQPETLTDYHGKSFSSCVRKKPTENEINITINGFDGDSVVDTKNHGGPHRAVHIFSEEHYAFFNNKNGSPLPVPAFGENITLQGYNEHDAHVGDILKVGDVILQISQPTERCSTMGKALHQVKLLKWIHEQLMTGFYARVLQPGKISKNSTIELIEKGPAELNINYLNKLLFKDKKDLGRLNRVCEFEVLSPHWIKSARKQFGRGSPSGKINDN